MALLFLLNLSEKNNKTGIHLKCSIVCNVTIKYLTKGIEHKHFSSMPDVTLHDRKPSLCSPTLCLPKGWILSHLNIDNPLLTQRASFHSVEKACGDRLPLVREDFHRGCSCSTCIFGDWTHQQRTQIQSQCIKKKRPLAPDTAEQSRYPLRQSSMRDARANQVVYNTNGDNLRVSVIL